MDDAMPLVLLLLLSRTTLDARTGDSQHPHCSPALYHSDEGRAAERVRERLIPVFIESITQCLPLPAHALICHTASHPH